MTGVPYKRDTGWGGGGKPYEMKAELGLKHL